MSHMSLIETMMNEFHNRATDFVMTSLYFLFFDCSIMLFLITAVFPSVFSIFSLNSMRKKIVKQVFKNFKACRALILKALTADFCELCGQCSSAAGVASAPVALWDTARLQQNGTLPIPLPEAPKPALRKFELSLSWSPYGSQMACGSVDSTISAFDAAQ